MTHITSKIKILNTHINMIIGRCKNTTQECYGFKELKLLFDVSSRLAKSRNITDEIQPVLQNITHYINAESTFLTILNRESESIYIEAAYGLSPAQQQRGKYKIGEGVIGRVVETRRAVVIERISQSPLFLNKTKQELTKQDKELAFICVPILEDNQVVGTLSATKIFLENVDYEDDKNVLSIVGTIITQAVRARQDRIEELQRLQEENKTLHNQLNSDLRPDNIVGNSGRMQDVYNLINMVSGTNATVLIRGESGCGKELIADAIHYSSNRAAKPFIKVNCSALPDSLIESELFGHERGAFTGADQRRKGRFELADGGTLFLDEIGDIPLTTQVKILRILQEQEFERVGGIQTIKTDTRIICATNRNLEKLIEEGKFREDLFYRINVFPVFLPPLRERRNDIPLLADHFIGKYNLRNKTKVKRITTSALNMLMVYSWPGNIRELENLVERACILSTDNVIHSYNLPPTLQTADSSGTASKGGMQEVLGRLERQLITEALTSTRGNISKSAKRLEITERMLGTRIEKHGINPTQFKV